MTRIVLSLSLILTLLAMTFEMGQIHQSTNAAFLPVGEGLYMKDTPADTGVEPNPDPGPMWITEDIWVRTTPDPGYQPYPFTEASPPWTPLPHENPEYRDPKFSAPNYIYVRIRNRGTSPSSGTERLKLYWAKASTGLSWPTQWVDFLSNTCGPTKLYGGEVTKPRKNAATATPAERDAYRNAILNVGTGPSFVFFGGVSYWHKQQPVHRFGPGNRHGTPAFLPWHREFLNRYEILLQEFDPTVKLLYWDWTTDPENSTGGFNFYPGFMGASGRGTGGVNIGAPFNPAAPPTLAPPSVTRNLSVNTTPPANADSSILTNGLFPLFATDIEQVPNHDSAHGYIGGGGDMSFISTAAQDPFFFLLHGNVDRIWAQWQRDPTFLSRLDPATAYDGDTGNVNITTSMRPWDGTGTGIGLIDPWTVAGGYVLSKTPTHVSVVSPPIYDTAPAFIPVLQPGQAVVIQIPWYPPNPADFACFSTDQGHFCLLGRIETATSSPFGMTTSEGSDVNANTRNNNKIVWKNITVVDNFAGALKLSSVLVRNVFREPVVTRLRMVNAAEIGASFFDFGRVFLKLKPEDDRRLRQRGLKMKGLRMSDTQDPERAQVLSPDAVIENIRLEPGEAIPVEVHFELNKNYRMSRGVWPKWDVIQIGAPGDPNAIVGGQRFELNLDKLSLIEDGADWRYLDNGSDLGSKWVSPDFDDSKWKVGHAKLGFGDEPVTTIDGGPPYQRHITTYFRKTFEVADPTFYRNLLLRLKRDDGAIVYLNGKEIHRINLPAGPVTAQTLATVDVSGIEEQVFFPVKVGHGLLRPRRNVVAVEVHQSSPRSNDLTFDLALEANRVSMRFSPDVAVASPVNGAQWQAGEVIPINVEALDSDGKIASVSLFAGGKLIGTDNQSPFTFQWRDAPLGSHRIRAVALDNDGQRSVSDTTINVLKNVPPRADLIQPKEGAMFRRGEVITALAEASDRVGKVERVEFWVREANMFISPNRLAGTARTKPYSALIKGLAPGHYRLSAVAWDNGGASSQSFPVHFEVQGNRANH